MTPILGETEDRRKVTGRDPRVLPQSVQANHESYVKHGFIHYNISGSPIDLLFDYPCQSFVSSGGGEEDVCVQFLSVCIRGLEHPTILLETASYE